MGDNVGVSGLNSSAAPRSVSRLRAVRGSGQGVSYIQATPSPESLHAGGEGGGGSANDKNLPHSPHPAHAHKKDDPTTRVLQTNSFELFDGQQQNPKPIKISHATG